MAVSQMKNIISTKRSNGKQGFTKEDLTGLLYVAPMVLGILIFSIYPMIDTFFLSLQQTNGITGKWIGFANYVTVFENPVFWQAVYNTLYMGILSVVIGLPLSFILATLINNVRWGKSLFKGLYFIPNIVSIVAMSILFRFLLAPTKEGLLNGFLVQLGINPIGWFTNPAMAKISIVIMGMWGFIGYDAIIFLAGLQSVPKELYEASEIDGASSIEKWWYITIPSMKPIFIFMIIMSTIACMKRFGDVFTIGTPTGNPAGSLLTVVLYIYRSAFTAGQVGIASAVAYVLFVMVLLLSLLIFKAFAKDDSSQ